MRLAAHRGDRVAELSRGGPLGVAQRRHDVRGAHVAIVHRHMDQAHVDHGAVVDVESRHDHRYRDVADAPPGEVLLDDLALHDIREAVEQVQEERLAALVADVRQALARAADREDLGRPHLDRGAHGHVLAHAAVNIMLLAEHEGPEDTGQAGGGQRAGDRVDDGLHRRGETGVLGRQLVDRRLRAPLRALELDPQAREGLPLATGVRLLADGVDLRLDSPQLRQLGEERVTLRLDAGVVGERGRHRRRVVILKQGPALCGVADPAGLKAHRDHPQRGARGEFHGVD